MEKSVYCKQIKIISAKDFDELEYRVNYFLGQIEISNLISTKYKILRKGIINVKYICIIEYSCEMKSYSDRMSYNNMTIDNSKHLDYILENFIKSNIKRGLINQDYQIDYDDHVIYYNKKFGDK